MNIIALTVFSAFVQLNPRCSNQVGTGVGQRVVPSRRARPHRPNSHHRSHITLFTNIKRPINIPPLCYTPHKHLTPLFVSSDATVRRLSSNTIQSEYRIRSTFAIHLFPFPYLYTWYHYRSMSNVEWSAKSCLWSFSLDYAVTSIISELLNLTIAVINTIKSTVSFHISMRTIADWITSAFGLEAYYVSPYIS